MKKRKDGKIIGNKVQFFKSFVSKIKGIFGKESNLFWEGASEKIATGTGRVISPKTGAAIANVDYQAEGL